MKVTIVVDNIEHAGIPGEWGFCAYIEQNGKKLLLDTGASNLFADNAEKLNIDLKDVDFAVLSHAHYDHANGMEKFFEINEKAPFYLQEGCGENCYFKKGFVRKYIGIPKGITKRYQDRIKYVSGICPIAEGIYLVSHSTPHLEQIGKKEMMYQKTKLGWKPDNFCHEQSLVLDTDSGLVIFNSCSHGGVVNIINEVKAAFPEQKITALIGGFHIFRHPEAAIRELAKLIKETGIQCIYTGHCSKEIGYRILREELGDMAGQFYVGMELEF